MTRRRITASIGAGLTAVVLAGGGYAIANDDPSRSPTTPTASHVAPFDRGNPTLITGTDADQAKAAARAAYPGRGRGVTNASPRG
jgi:hypothetical protein